MSKTHENHDLTNHTIAGFSILHRLGVGGMSEVYLAFQESLHRHVALKVMRADFVGLADHEQRFLQEARAVASLMHPNIVQVYDVGKFESIHYIAQEYVPGSNLHAYVQRRGALPLRESISILWQATAALQKAASIGLVHRDIKPDNLLLTPDGEVKVADFGLARARGQSQNLTAVGVTLGTPLYMSPEQIQGLSVDSRSDLYSLGATAYHMLAGRPPFSGETALALAMQHVHAVPTRLDELRPDLPQSLVEIIHRLLAKNPDDRFASAGELHRALREVVESALDGHVDQMVPFSGLVIDHQRISNHATTQQLQSLARQQLKPAKKRWVLKAMFAVIAFLVGTLASLVIFQKDLFYNQTISTNGVVRQSSIQRQYALALLENDLPHWSAISRFFPPTDAVTRNYGLKAELQIARNAIEAKEYGRAAEPLLKVLGSAYSDDVTRTIARIELAFISLRGMGEGFANAVYDRAIRDMKLLDDAPEKQRLVRDSLPPVVRLEWDRLVVDRQNEIEETKDSGDVGLHEASNRAGAEPGENVSANAPASKE